MYVECQVETKSYLWQFFYELVSVCSFCRSNHLFVRNAIVWQTISNVVAQGEGEQHWFLKTINKNSYGRKVLIQKKIMIWQKEVIWQKDMR